MTIKQRLQNDMKEAMKNKDKASLTNIRMMIDRIQKKEKDQLRDLTEDEVVQVIQTFRKQVQEEADAYANAGKFSVEAVLMDSIALIDKYLPKLMTEEEITLVVGLAISGLAKNGRAVNKGAVMKAVMPKVKGKADNKLVNEIVTKHMEVIGR